MCGYRPTSAITEFNNCYEIRFGSYITFPTVLTRKYAVMQLLNLLLLLQNQSCMP